MVNKTVFQNSTSFFKKRKKSFILSDPLPPIMLNKQVKENDFLKSCFTQLQLYLVVSCMLILLLYSSLS